MIIPAKISVDSISEELFRLNLERAVGGDRGLAPTILLFRALTVLFFQNFDCILELAYDKGVLIF